MLIRHCLCCGKEFNTYPSKVARGQGKYCSTACSHTVPTNSTHGMSGTRLYRVWMNMRRRCCDPNNQNFAYYGGRGIAVCREWDESFETFRDWAVRTGYSDSLEIDRADVDGGYRPDNCRRATRSQQVTNSRKRANATSKYKGVYWNTQAGKWVAQIMCGGVMRRIGTYRLETEAASAYDREAAKAFGEFALTNY